MLNSVTNLKCTIFVEKMTDLLATLSHIIFNMSLALDMLFQAEFYLYFTNERT
jgi:hypothetical protein